MAKAYHNTNGRSDHETPPALFWVLWKLRQFNLDVAASRATAKVPNYYGLDNNRDGLARQWVGRWFCNPPYGRQGSIRSWLRKGVQEALAGRWGAFLIPARVGTAWYWENCKEWEQWILPGRLTFWVNGRPLDSSAGFPSVVVHMGPTYRTGSVKFWDWRDDLERLSKAAGLGDPPANRERYDHLRLGPNGWEFVGPWTRAESAAILQPDKFPDLYAELTANEPIPAHYQISGYPMAQEPAPVAA